VVKGGFDKGLKKKIFFNHRSKGYAEREKEWGKTERCGMIFLCWSLEEGSLSVKELLISQKFAKMDESAKVKTMKFKMAVKF
jgi:hypothetical protein